MTTKQKQRSLYYTRNAVKTDYRQSYNDEKLRKLHIGFALVILIFCIALLVFTK